jgi:nicotinamidase-related amidase
MSSLNALRVDTVILTGTTTSGCVRATAVDSFSYNFNTVVVEECVFDRSLISHKVSLFDLNAKYADVVDLKTVTEYLNRIGAAEAVAPVG